MRIHSEDNSVNDTTGGGDGENLNSSSDGVESHSQGGSNVIYLVSIILSRFIKKFPFYLRCC